MQHLLLVYLIVFIRFVPSLICQKKGPAKVIIMAGKGKVAVRELGENLIRLSRVGDLSGIKDLLDTQEDHEFVAAAINFREQKV